MLNTLAARRGIAITEQRRGEILSGFASLKANDDIVPALKRLRDAGYRTVAFSNSLPNLVTGQIRHAGLTECYDEIVSVEATGSF